MKFLPLSLLSSCLVFSSCSSLIKDEAAPENPSQGRAIPPPQGHAQLKEKSAEPQKELPALTATKPEEKKETPVVNDTQFGDYVFRDDLADLPSQSDLTTPVAPLPGNQSDTSEESPAAETEKGQASSSSSNGQSNLSAELSEPLASNP